MSRYYPGSYVSRVLDPAEYSWDGVVTQSGRPLLDADLNLLQDLRSQATGLLAGAPSGWLRAPEDPEDPDDDFTFPSPPVAGQENRFSMARRVARVAGMPVVVDRTNTVTAGTNVILLGAASAATGASPDVRRMDFVFLEVWRAQVAPPARASGTVTFADPSTIAGGDAFTIDLRAVGGLVVVLTARAVPATPNEFAIGGSPESTAAAFAAAFNGVANSIYPTYVAARAGGTRVVTLTTTFGGTDGNLILISRTEAVAGSIVLSGANLTGGADTVNRPGTGTQTEIYRNGNVDAGSNLADDTVDPILNLQSTQRVQVQYRVRVYEGLDLSTNPDGFSDPALLARGATAAPVAGYPFVPADNSTVLASSDSTAYGTVDGGLWIAGDGSSGAATALGTADGFSYAIPLAVVFRRNNAAATGGFDPVNNANGALSLSHAGFTNTHLETAPVAIVAGASDRPDGLFHDAVVLSDVMDCRRTLARGYADLGRRTLSGVFARTLRTWALSGSDLGTIGNGSGDVSPEPLICNDISRTTVLTTAGDKVRSWDHVARRFSDAPVVERIVFSVLPVGPFPAGIAVTKAAPSVNTWCEGDEVEIDFDTLEASSLQDWTTPVVGAPTVGAAFPTGTKITGLLSAYHDDGNSGGGGPVDQNVQFASVTGIGTRRVNLILDSNPQVADSGGLGPAHPLVDAPGLDAGSTRRLFLELEVTYPAGYGLTKAPLGTLTPTAASGYDPYDAGPVVEPDTSQRPPEMVPTWVPEPVYREGVKEVVFEQWSGDTAVPANVITDTLVTRNNGTVYFPRRIATTTSLLANAAVPVAATVGSSERRVDLIPPVAGQVAVAVEYYAQDPIPDAGLAGYQLLAYYRTRAPQTAGASSGVPSTTLLPTFGSFKVLQWGGEFVSIVAGSGTAGEPSAFPGMSEGVPLALPEDESDLASGMDVEVTDFDTDEGWVSLSARTTLRTDSPLRLGDALSGPAVDAEGRVYYPVASPVDVRAGRFYGATRSKGVAWAVVTATADTLLYRRGEPMLLVLTGYNDLTRENRIEGSALAASLYRLRGLPVLDGSL